MKKRILTVVTIFLLSLLFLPVIFAEVVILRDGTRMQGELIERTAEYIKIDYQGQELMFPNSVVSTITLDALSPFDDEGEVDDSVL